MFNQSAITAATLAGELPFDFTLGLCHTPGQLLKLSTWLSVSACLPPEYPAMPMRNQNSWLWLGVLTDVLLILSWHSRHQLSVSSSSLSLYYDRLWCVKCLRIYPSCRLAKLTWHSFMDLRKDAWLLDMRWRTLSTACQ